MLEKIILTVCQEMRDSLSDKQIQKLQNVLFIVLHDKDILETEKYEVVLSEDDNDARHIKEFIASKNISGRSKNTLENYYREIWNCRTTIGKSFRDISSIDLRWYFGMLKETRNNSMGTIEYKRHYLSSFYSFLIAEGYVSSNPLLKIEPFKIEKRLKHAFSEVEIEALRDSCESIRDRVIIEFLYQTGVRVSELCSLNVSNLDLRSMEFTVVGKGNKERVLYITDTMMFYLNKYFQWAEHVLGRPMRNKDPLFISTKPPYERLNPPGVRVFLKKLGVKSNVTNVHPHRFRRSFATSMISKMRIDEVMVLMGHTKIDTTMIYIDSAQTSIKDSFHKAISR